MTSRTWNNLVSAITRLPGVGPKMAERIALHLLRHGEEAQSLLQSLEAARQHLQRCPMCGDFVEAEDETPAQDKKEYADVPCEKCRDPKRDTQALCVVEEIGDLKALERSRAFHGRYHVLGGVLSALEGIGPEDLRIDSLLDRVKRENVQEVILATNPTAEGETTANYLADLLKSMGVAVTRLAYG
ncbi:MAG: recombination protein RecR, partial [Elusimicrobia bacterium]|nr:recombination protein RecR [Elusimicrobiota bacterium]